MVYLYISHSAYLNLKPPKKHKYFHEYFIPIALEVHSEICLLF